MSDGNVDVQVKASDHRLADFLDDVSGETASATFSTCALISLTCGWTSRIKSCSALESCSMRWVTSCSSFNIACGREQMRCIHQKPTSQQPMPIQVRVITTIREVISHPAQGFQTGKGSTRCGTKSVQK